MPLDQQTIRFGTYTVNLQSGELYKSGAKINLPGQSFQVLTSLLERPGDVVTRKALEEKLWPDGTVVDYEHSLNAAVKRLREALNDAADNPQRRSPGGATVLSTRWRATSRSAAAGSGQ
jgi:DNA-binding winged helix-turn-helix (wHTH) protein